MARRNKDSSRPPASRADWLGREHTKRQRPWALKEQLLGSSHARESEERLDPLAQRLSDERTALLQMETALQGQMDKVSELESQLETITAQRYGVESPLRESTAKAHPAPTVRRLRSTNPPPDRDYWLSRCEGFSVESPIGRHIGIVVGIRFGLRIDRPDLLEVATGHIRRRVLLVPIAEVESITEDNERVVLTKDPLQRHDFAHRALAKASGKLHISPS